MRALAALLPLLVAAPAVQAQDFYDIDVLRTVNLDFHDANWFQLLEQNYQSQTLILADMTVEGVVYPDVGVRIRGNTSYLFLPANSMKVSLNVTVDHVHPDQEVMGHSTLNFNNAFTDPTFCREVVFHNILAQYVPAGRANHIHLTLNGDDWGVYANIQQYGKNVLRDWFEDEDGLRVKCANNPNGPGLQYMGTNPANYNVYEIKDDGGLADPVGAIIAVCDAVDNTAPANWPQIDQVVAIDPSIWNTVLENLYSDDDSYVNKGCDFVMYRNPIDGRMHLHQTDANESWTHANWSATHNFNANNKPFLSNVLDAPELRARWFAHMREALEDFDPLALNSEFAARRQLIDAAVQADPHKLYSYQKFLDNFNQTVTLGGGGPFGNQTVIGIRQYINQRRALLLGNAEVAATVPDIQDITSSGNVPGTSIFITATVTGSLPIASVTLYYRADQTSTYQSVAMLDDGASGDGAAGDGVYGVRLPVAGVGGQTIEYYVGAASQDAFLSTKFEPRRTEWDPLLLTFQGGEVESDVVINELLARNNSVVQDPSGSFEDYVELYNKGDSTIDLSGMYMSDSLLTPTEWQIPAGTMLAPGDTILIWADEDLLEGPLHADFKFSADGEEVGLWDTDGTTLLDSLTFGPQEADISTGQLHDGDGLMVTFPVPTPDALNDGGCGVRAYDQLDPLGHALDLAGTGSGAIGTTLILTGSGMQASTPVTLLFDLAPAYTPVTTGIVGLMGASNTIDLFTDAGGVMVLPIPIPDEPLIVGLDVYLQTAGFDTGGAPAASNALHLSICP